MPGPTLQMVMMMTGINFSDLLVMQINTVLCQELAVLPGVSSTSTLYSRLCTPTAELPKIFLQRTVPKNELAYLSCVFSKHLYYAYNCVYID
jgi:precorrin-6B methylase 1